MTFLRMLFSKSRLRHPLVHLDRESGSAVLVAGRRQDRDEILSCLPARRVKPFELQHRGEEVYGLRAPITSLGRALRQAGWGQAGCGPREGTSPPPERRPPPQPAPGARRGGANGRSSPSGSDKR